MDEQQHQHGVVGPGRRRLVVIACAIVGLATLTLGVVLNWVTHSPVVWGWLAVAVGVVMGVYAVYLWIRLSD